jgi:NAD(P)-dependent dehydrogenase (short-subunit alcohol dehydrogenase family)
VQRAKLVMSDLFDVSKQIILVTGASRRLDRQLARVLAAHGRRRARGREMAKLKTLRTRSEGRARR